MSSVKADGLRDDKGNGFGFGSRMVLVVWLQPCCLVAHFVCEFVNKGAELFCWLLTGEESNASAVAHSQSGSDAVIELKLLSLKMCRLDRIPCSSRADQP